MLLIGLESSRSPHQCFFRPLLPMLLRTTHFLPREPTERQFLFKSSRALARCLLLSYNVSKGPELSNQTDPNSAPTGNTCFVLSEIYETRAGVLDHFEQGFGNWGDVQAMVKWMEKCKVTLATGTSIFNSLW